MIYTETDEIKYDLKNHRYIITDRYLQDAYGFSVADYLRLDKTEDVDRYLKRVSNIIYDYIFSRQRSQDDITIIEYCIASNVNKRDEICRAMAEYCYSQYNGEFDNSYRNGLTNNKRFSMQDLRENAVSLEVLRILHNAGLEQCYHRITDISVDDMLKLKAEGEY